MTAQIIDGKAVAADIQSEIAQEVRDRKAKGLRPPGLAVILVGDNPASRLYISSKTRICGEIGFHSLQIDLPGDASPQDVLREVERLNQDPMIDGILVQSPLPKQISELEILEAIDPSKDVDGFHPVNRGRLASGQDCFVACTPLGVREMLLRYDVETEGAFAVVLGRSNIVGNPMAQLLLRKERGGNATVCVCHSRTKNLAEYTRQADILIAAIGQAEFVRGEMVKPGATVIDVGMNRIEDASRERGFRVVGDVHRAEVLEVAGKMSKVPGGVGPMTIAMLMSNTLKSAQLRDP